MRIVRADHTQATKVLDLIKKAYTPLLEKYQDVAHSPATKSLESLIEEIQHPTSDSYLLKRHRDYIGYVRVNNRGSNEYGIADLCIDPSFQGNGYAQHFLQEIELLYADARRWSLVTILEEEKDCYLYEKMGYIQEGILAEIHANMHFVLYLKDSSSI